MKALSLLQPWASLVVMGHKRIETRSWNTGYRGPLLIHASKGKGGAGIAANDAIARYIPDFDALPFGAIIGKVMLVDTLRFGSGDFPEEQVAELTLEERAFGDYRSGRWGWLFNEAVMFREPIPARGHLSLWEADVVL